MVALDAQGEVEAQLGALKEKQAKMGEQVKYALRQRDSAEAGLKTIEKQARMVEQVKDALRQRNSAKAGLKTTEKQVEDIRKELHYCEINLATEK